MHSQENGGAIAHVLKDVFSCKRLKSYANMDISSMLEVQVNEVKETDIKENVTPGSLQPRGLLEARDISNEEKNVYKQIFANGVAAVRFGRLHCTSCDTHIGSAPAESCNMFEHPVLKTLLCAKCHEFYGDGTFEQGDDATDMFCRWCANGGSLYCCSYCSNTFCFKCIRRNLGHANRKKIEADEKWKCFVCDPSILYSLRGMCWALLEHVQTLTRIIQDDTTSTPEEIEYKMNLDESRCCPRRRKRKRRRASNSEEEDETYTPDTDEAFVSPKRKMLKKTFTPVRPNLLNGTPNNDMRFVQAVRIAPKPLTKTEPGMTKLIPILPRDKMKIGPETSANKEHMPSPSSSSDTPKTLKVIPRVQSNTPILSPVPTAKLLKPTTSTAPSPASTHSSFTMPTYQCVPPRLTPMVSIPTQQNMVQRIVITNSVRLAAPKITPNIIDIDSDSEESGGTNSSDASASQMNSALNSTENAVKLGSTPSTAVPVALVSARSAVGNEVRPDQPLRERQSTIPRFIKGFNQILQPYEREVEGTFNVLKYRFRELVESIKRDENRGLDPDNAKVSLRRFHRLIRIAVLDLAGINDRVVRGYNKWRRFAAKKVVGENAQGTSPITTKEKDLDLPLHMTCTAESDEESEIPEPLEYDVISPTPVAATSNVLEDLLLCAKRKCVDRGVGESVSSESKSVQVDNVEFKDYEGSIFYSVVKEHGSSSKQSLSTSQTKNPATVPSDTNSQTKYEQEFLRFLKQKKEGSPEDSEDIHESSEQLQVDLAEDTSASSNKECTTTTADLSSKLQQCNNSVQGKTANVIEKIKTIIQENESALRNGAGKTVKKRNAKTKSDRVTKIKAESFSNTTEDIPSSNNIKSDSNVIISNATGRETSNESEDDCTIIDE